MQIISGRLLSLLGGPLVSTALLSLLVSSGTVSGSAAIHPRPRAGRDSLDRWPLRQLSPAADAYLAARAGSIGVAVIIPGAHVVYAAQSGPRFPLASLTKLAIMVTVLDRSSREQRALTVQEVALLEAMIERSDNAAASTLWAAVGGGSAVSRYLHSIGLTDFVPGTDGHWGDSTDTALDVAKLLGGLADGSLLAANERGLAVVLMSRIVPSQRWGVTAGLSAGALLAFKNGWLQADDGTWELDSAGVVFPESIDAAYGLVILTEDQPTLQYGVQTIEDLATLLHGALGTGQ